MKNLRISPQEIGYLRLFIDLITEDKQNYQKNILNNNKKIVNILSNAKSDSEDIENGHNLLI